MEKLNVILSDGIEKEVDCLFYLYNSKYYFIYTEKEIDENGYVVLYVTQVGKEIKNTPNGPIDTGYMVGVEINDEEEWKSVQASISKIVESAKTGTSSTEVQILPLSMLSKLKIFSKKTFRLMREIVINNLNVDIRDEQYVEPVTPVSLENTELNQNVQVQTPITGITEESIFNNEIQNNIIPDSTEQQGLINEDSNIIIDYRTKFFEEQEKNSQLQKQIDELNNKLTQIKDILN